MKEKRSLLKKIGGAATGIFLLAVMTLYLPVMALADDWDIAVGNITVEKTDAGQNVSQVNGESKSDDNPTITGTSDTNTVTISAAPNTTATVTFRDLNIDVSSTGDYMDPGLTAVNTTGAGNVIINLDGENTVASGYNRAGIQKENTGNLTITGTDGTNTDSLSAAGGSWGAGIGGGEFRGSSNITITGIVNVNATGGSSGAGIGGGFGGDSSNITISGNANVTATGGVGAAGIGGGNHGVGSNITISGNSTVVAVGGACGAGIGSGFGGDSSNITISGSTDVSAAGGGTNGDYGAGAAIGGGGNEYGEDGTEVDVNTSGLTGGSVNRFDPGTTVEQIQNGIPDPNPQARPAAIEPSDSEAVSGGNAQTAPVSEAFSLSAVLDTKIETFLQQLAALLASGRPDLIRALMKAGFSMDLGDFTMLNAKTCALLAQVADAGIPVNADYTYGGVNYRVTIPAGEGASVNALASDGVCTVEELMSAFETQTR